MQDKLIIRGARSHNLKNITLEIPRNSLTVITGLSGSGKSTLAFDTIYAEGQRRYVESLSAYARQFLGVMNKPDVDSIEGLSPAISIEQKTTSRNPRSTVGTTTEIYDYLRLLYARIGKPYCPQCGKPITSQTTDQIANAVLMQGEGKNAQVIAPVIRGKKGTYEKLFDELRQKGFSKVRLNGGIMELGSKIPKLDKNKRHTIEVIVDRFTATNQNRQRLVEAIKTGIRESGEVLPCADERLSGLRVVGPRLDDGVEGLHRLDDLQPLFDPEPVGLAEITDLDEVHDASLCLASRANRRSLAFAAIWRPRPA